MDIDAYKKRILKTIHLFQPKLFRDCFKLGELALNIKELNKNICLFRHDVDISPKNALLIAETEASLGIFFTFTVWLGSLYYNPFEIETKKILIKILELGHEIGLHFDAKAYEIENEYELVKYLSMEKTILQDFLATDVTMFSFHDTTDFTMSCQEPHYAGMTNAYSKFFQDSVDYSSDSNGYWRYTSWDSILESKREIIQILTHPIWWGPAKDFQPMELILKHLFQRTKDTIETYVDNFSGQSLEKIDQT